ncbi:MAG: tail fiber domain-containing protein [Bacteriovoracia bacterium]
MRTIFFLLLFFLHSNSAEATGDVPYGFVLDGTLYNSPTGTATLQGTGTIRVQIMNPAKSCILYDEQQSFNTSASDGAFSISVGTAVGSGRRVVGSDAGNSMTSVFQNRVAIGGASACSYTPAVGDTRYVRVFVTPTSTGITDQLIPDMLLGSVPSAIVAETLQGIDKTGFAQLGAGSLTQANVENIFSATNYPALTALLAAGGSSSGGTSSGNYVVNAGTGGAGGINFNINGSTKAGISNGGDFTVGSSFLVNGSNGRVGIGSSSPSYDFSLGGNTSRTMAMERNTTADTAGNALTIGAGSATSAATDKNGGDLYLASGTATGAGSSNIYLQTAGAGVSSTADRAPSTKVSILGNGNVGIGTNSPLSTLQVRGTSADVNGNGIMSFDTNSGANDVGVKIGALAGVGSAGYAFIQGVHTAVASDGNLILNPNAGNVGIGTSAPTSPLHIAFTNTATSGTVTGLQITSSYNQASGTAANTDLLVNRTQTAVGSGNQYLMDLQVGGASKASVTSVGWLSLASGLSAPTMQSWQWNNSGYTGSSASAAFPGLQQLQVVNVANNTDGNTASLNLGVYNSSSLSQQAYISAVSTTGAANYNPALTFGTTTGANSYAERMRIDSNGNVGIGTTTPAYKLDITGDVNATGCLRSSAGIASGTCVSDERLKTDVHSFDLGLEALLGINSYVLRYNGLGEHPATEKPELGVLAQEVERTAPQLVTTREVKLYPGDARTTEIKQVNYTAFTYVLINAVKDLYRRWMDDSREIHREVAALRAENAEMRARLDKLEKVQ